MRKIEDKSFIAIFGQTGTPENCFKLITIGISNYNIWKSLDELCVVAFCKASIKLNLLVNGHGAVNMIWVDSEVY